MAPVESSTAYPAWVRGWAWGCVAVAAPTIVWRALVGAGISLGTPVSWREAQQIPGPGTSYVLGLSAVQLLAALAAPLLLSKPVIAVPRALAATAAGLGAIALALVVVLSIVNWSTVDPFHGQPMTIWKFLCTGCYLSAVVWPIALAVTLVGYLGFHPRSRESA